MTLPSEGAVARFCATVDRLNNFMGRAWGLTILAVTFAVLYEVVARGVFGQATLWANETTIYLSAMAYLIAGGYALQRRMHVRIDVLYLQFSRRGQLYADIFGFVFFFLYTATLIWVGGQSAWTSFLQGETTGTPWNPPIWPVKVAIPLAGLLLLLQGIANILRDLSASQEKASG